MSSACFLTVNTFALLIDRKSPYSYNNFISSHSCNFAFTRKQLALTGNAIGMTRFNITGRELLDRS